MAMRVPDIAPSTRPITYLIGGSRPGAFGIGGKGLAQLGQGLAAAAAVQTATDQEESIAAIQLAVADTQRRINDRLYHPESGFFTLKGKNAIEAREPTLRALQEEVAEGAKGLKTAAERNTYGLHLGDMLNQRRVEIDKFAAGARQDFLDRGAQAEIETYYAEAQQNGNAPLEQIGGWANAAAETAGTRAHRNGRPEEVVTLEGAAARSTVVRVAIATRVNNGNVVGAEEALARFGGAMTEPDRQKATALVAEGRHVEAVQQVLRHLKTMPEDKAWTSVTAINDPRVRNEVQAEYGRLVTLRKQDQRDQQEEQMRRFYEAVEQGEIKSLSDLTAVDRVLLGPEGRNKLKDYVSMREQGIKHNDLAAIGHLEDLSRQYPQQFRDVNLETLLETGKITLDAYQHYKSRQRDIEVGLPSSLSDDQALSAAFSRWGLTDKEKQEKIRWMVRDALAAEESRQNRKLTYEEQKKTIDRAILEIKAENTGLLSWWDKTKTTRVHEIDNLNDLPEDFVDLLREEYPHLTNNDLLKKSIKIIMEGGYERYNAIDKVKTLKDIEPEVVAALRNKNPEISDKDIINLYKKALVFMEGVL